MSPEKEPVTKIETKKEIPKKDPVMKIETKRERPKKEAPKTPTVTPWTITSLRLALVLIVFASAFVFFDTIAICASFLWHGFMTTGANAPAWVVVATLTVLVGVPALGMAVFSILILALSREKRRVSYWMTLIFFILMFFFSIITGLVYFGVLIFFSILAVAAANAAFWIIYLFFLISIGCMASIPIWSLMGFIMMFPKGTRDFYKPKDKKKGRGFRL